MHSSSPAREADCHRRPAFSGEPWVGGGEGDRTPLIQIPMGEGKVSIIIIREVSFRG